MPTSNFMRQLPNHELVNNDSWRWSNYASPDNLIFEADVLEEDDALLREALTQHASTLAKNARFSFVKMPKNTYLDFAYRKQIGLLFTENRTVHDGGYFMYDTANGDGISTFIAQTNVFVNIEERQFNSITHCHKEMNFILIRYEI